MATAGSASPGTSSAPNPPNRWLLLDNAVDEVILDCGGRRARTQIPLRVWQIEQYFQIHDAEFNGVREEVDELGFTLKRHQPWSTVVVTGKPGAPPPLPPPQSLFMLLLDWFIIGSQEPTKASEPSARTSDRPEGGAAEPSSSLAESQQAGSICGSVTAHHKPSALPHLPWVTAFDHPEVLLVHGMTRVRVNTTVDGRLPVEVATRVFKLKDVRLNGVAEEVDESDYTLTRFPPCSVITVTGEPVDRATQPASSKKEYDDKNQGSKSKRD